MSETKSARFFSGISDKLSGALKQAGAAVGKSDTGKQTNQDGGARRKSGMMRLQRSRTRSAARAGGSRKRSSKRSSQKRKRSSGSKRRSHKRRRGIKGGIGAML